MKPLKVAVITVFAVCLCPAQGRPDATNSGTVRGETTGSSVQEVLEVKRQYDDAQLKNDRAWFERMFADDLSPSCRMVRG